MEVFMKLIEYISKYSKDLAKMVQALYAEDPGDHPFDQSKLDSTIKYFSQYPETGQIYLICQNFSIAGYIIVTFYWSNEYGGKVLIIDEFYIEPSSRGLGLGTECFKIIENIYRNSIAAMQLEVTSKNRAHNLYICLGFTLCPNIFLIKIL